jgi:hypothetical protein
LLADAVGGHDAEPGNNNATGFSHNSLPRGSTARRSMQGETDT